MIDGRTQFDELLKRESPQRITAKEARARRYELHIVAAWPRYESLETDTIVYKDDEGNYYRMDRRRNS